jgi:hypothetical protein
MVLNHTQVLMPSNNPFLEALRLDTSPMVGEVVPLLLPTVHRGVYNIHQPDLRQGGVAAVADGVDGVVVRRKWHSKRPRGVGEVVLVSILGLSHHHSFLSKLGVVLLP